MTTRDKAYWAATGLFCALLGFSGIAHTARIDFVAEGVTGLGYPAYLMTILGVAKLLGVVALLAPGRPVLKEWAYAGFTFNLLGAAISHGFVGDPLGEALRPLGLLAFCAASYLLRPASRRILAAPTLSAASQAAPAAAGSRR